MDFEEIFSKIQGLLKRSDQTVGPLKKLKSRGGNESAIIHIVSQLHNLLIQYKYLDNNQKHLNEGMLRKITFFLVLNCDLIRLEDLTNEPNVGHVTGICPLLTPCILYDCIWGLNLGQYLGEILTYGPVTLSLELLKDAVTSVQFSLPYPLLDRIKILIYATYMKIYRLKIDKIYYMRLDQSLSSLVERLIELLQYYISPKSFKDEGWGISELYRYTGYTLKSILELTNDCLEIYINKSPKISEHHKLFEIEYNVGAEFYISPDTKHEKIFKCLSEINKCLLSACQANLKAINVKIFCSWSEFKLESSNQTIQNYVATYAHIINEKLLKLDIEPEFYEELSGMFSAIAIKPLTIEEEIQQADLETILKNVPIENENQKLWFKKFLSIDKVLTDEEHRNFLKNYLKLCDIEDAHKLLFLTHSLQNNENIELDQCKLIALEALQNLSTEDQLKLIITFHELKHFSTFYEQTNFNENLIETFNKIVSIDGLNSILYLLIQNPQKVLKNIFEECFKSDLKTNLMVDILKHFKSLCQQRIQNGGDQPIGLCLLKEVCDQYTTKEFQQTFVHCIQKITEENIISAENVAQEILFPNIYKFMVDKDFANVLLWLEGCKEICQQESFIKLYTPFILFLAQMLNHSRNDINTFSVQSLNVLQLSISITIIVVNNVKSKNLISNEDIAYLKDSLSTESIVNRYYFEPLWNNANTNYFNYIFMGSLKDHERSWNVSRFLELLPFSTLDEWKILSLNILEEQPDSLEYFKMLSDFINLLATVVKQSSSQTSLSCFECCIKHFTMTLNDIIFPKIDDSYNAQLIVWETLLYMVILFPKDIKENCCQQLIKILIPLLEKLKQKNSKVYSITVYDLISLENTEACKVICKKITE